MIAPLDPVTARAFPTVARYARKMRWVVHLAAAGIIYTIGFHNGLFVGTYRGQVADELYNSTVREFHQFKEDYMKRFGKDLQVTKAQANDWRYAKERKAAAQGMTARREEGRE